MTISTSTTYPRAWNGRLLLLGNVFVALLMLSLFSPLTQNLWKALDISFFHFINAPLASSPKLRVFWALSNHRLADWVEDLCFLGLYIAAIWHSQKGKRKQMGIQLFICVLITAATIFLINRILCRDILHVRRHSPTYLLDESVILSKFISWMSVKVDSSKSFPGDHATTALMITLSYAYLVRGRLALLALAYGFFLCLPRLAVGAHWVSDIAVGSGSIVLFALSWVFFTPFFSWLTSRVERFFTKIPS